MSSYIAAVALLQLRIGMNPFLNPNAFRHESTLYFIETDFVHNFSMKKVS